MSVLMEKFFGDGIEVEIRELTDRAVRSLNGSTAPIPTEALPDVVASAPETPRREVEPIRLEGTTEPDFLLSR